MGLSNQYLCAPTKSFPRLLDRLFEKKRDLTISVNQVLYSRCQPADEDLGKMFSKSTIPATTVRCIPRYYAYSTEYSLHEEQALMSLAARADSA